MVTRIKHVARLIAGGTPPVDDPEMWATQRDGIPWVTITDMTRSPVVTETARRLSYLGARTTRSAVAPAGTVLFAMYASVGAVGRLGVEGTWNQAILGIVPTLEAADARFLGYWLEHLGPSLGALYRSNTQNNLNAEQVGNLPFPSLSLQEQWRIADFLDVETARIDRLAELRLDAAALAAERHQIVEDDIFRVLLDSQPVLPLKYLSDVTVGIVVTPSVWYVESGGVSALRGLNVEPGHIVTESLVEISHLGNVANSKSRLAAGDVVVVRTGQAGAAAVVPDELDGANCIDLLIVRQARNLLPGFLEHFLNSATAARAVAEESVGSIQAHYNVGALKRLPIPVPPLRMQQRLLDDLEEERRIYDARYTAYRRQMELLLERRSALITAAVTGALDFATAGRAA